MRLVALSPSYPPEIGSVAQRFASWCEQLVAWGHHVSVLCPVPNFPRRELYPGYDGRYREEIIRGVNVVRVPAWLPAGSHAHRDQLLQDILFSARGAIAAKRAMEADIVLTESRPFATSSTAVALARALRAKLVLHIGDSALNLAQSNVSARAAKWMLRRADGHLGQSPQGLLGAHQVAPNVPQLLCSSGVDLSTYRAAPARSETRARFGWAPDRIVVGYTGLLHERQSPAQIIEAATLLRNDGRFLFALFGDGPQRHILETTIRYHNLPNIALHGMFPFSDMPAIQTALDIAVVPMDVISARCGARPQKLLEHMAAGVPIVLCGLGETADMLLSAASGPLAHVVPSGDPRRLAQALRELCENSERASVMAARASMFVEAHFERSRIGRQLEDFLLDIAAPSRCAA